MLSWFYYYDRLITVAKLCYNKKLDFAHEYDFIHFIKHK